MIIKSSLGRSVARLASSSSVRARALAVAGAVVGLSVYTGIVAIPAVEAANVPCDSASLVNALTPISGSGQSGTLSLAAGCTYTMTAVNNTFDGPNAFPDILGSVTIIGNGATITRSGSTPFRFFVVDDGGSLNISNLTLSNGLIATGELHGGGAILNRDHLTMNGVIVSGNHSMGSTGGGGIDNHDKGVLTVTNSTISGNVGLQGGGIEDEATLCHMSTSVCGSASVSNTTFSGNSTTMFGGGGFEGQLDSTSAPICPLPASSPPVECQEPGGAHDTLTGDTFTGNTSVTEGGGIAIFGTATVKNSTVTNNSTGSGGGGGIQNTGALTVVASTISGNSTTSPTGSDLHSFTDVTHQPGTTGVSMSIMGSGTGANCGGTNAMTDNGYNIDSGNTCNFSSGNHSQINTDPLLNSLASNGGPTQTMSLQGGSPAIGAGPASCPVSTDQRGAPRSSPCDVGAFEVYATPPTAPSLNAMANGTAIDLSWSASSSPLGIVRYDIFRDGSPLATVSGSTLSYADTTATPNTTYTYTVDAFDGNLTSALSNPASAMLGNSLGGILGSPASVGVSSWSATRVDVFIQGADRALWQNTWNGTTWSGWSSLGGVTTGGPGAVSWSSGRIDVFVRGQDNALWHRSSDGTTWSGWENLGGGLSYGPAVASWGSDRLDIFIVGLDHQLWHKYWNGQSWGPWEPLGGILTSQPAAVSWGPNQIDIVARGADNQLWHMAWTGNAWSGWVPLGGLFNYGAAIASCASGHLDVYGVGQDYALWHDSWNGSQWSGWQSMGGTWTAGPGAVCEPGTNTVQLIDRAPEGSGVQTPTTGT